MITLEKEVFQSLTPGSNFQPLFEDGSTVKLIDFLPDANIDYGTREVAGFKVEVDGVEKVVPAPAITGAIVNTPGTLKNEGDEVLECADTAGRSFHAVIEATAKDKEKVALPNEIKVIRRVTRGVPKKTALPRMKWYEESHLVEEGKTFKEAFKDMEYVPALFKNEFGSYRTGNVYLLEPID